MDIQIQVHSAFIFLDVICLVITLTVTDIALTVPFNIYSSKIIKLQKKKNVLYYFDNLKM